MPVQHIVDDKLHITASHSAMRAEMQGFCKFKVADRLKPCTSWLKVHCTLPILQKTKKTDIFSLHLEG